MVPAPSRSFTNSNDEDIFLGNWVSLRLRVDNTPVFISRRISIDSLIGQEDLSSDTGESLGASGRRECDCYWRMKGFDGLSVKRGDTLCEMNWRELSVWTLTRFFTVFNRTSAA